jgi:integrase/recombinase XerD
VLRACEIAALSVGDVFDEAGGIKDTIYLSSTQTKGSDSATVLANSKLKRQLEKFGQQYPSHISNKTAPLLFSAKGSDFTAQTIVSLFKRIYQLAGIDGASSHSGRRQFVTQLADRGINARLVQVLARHKYLSTTQRYIDVNDNKLRVAIELIQ